MSVGANAMHPLADRERYTDAGRTVLAELEARLECVYNQVTQSPIWDAVMDPTGTPARCRAVLREVMTGVAEYQPLTTEAGFTMLGRLPKHEGRLLATLLAHKAEEAEHGLWARRDAGLLGAAAEAQPISPAAFAIAAVWDRLARVEDPFAYLGAEYLFEGLTARIAPEVLQSVLAKGLPAGDLGFFAEHATEDIEHTNLIVHWILDIASRYPESGVAMIRGFDYFAQVYPLPLWNEAFARV